MFSVEMPHVVEDQFNLKPRHDIHRFGGAKRGYRGIRVAVQIPEVLKEPYVPNLE
jgi:hypothetical protein